MRRAWWRAISRTIATLYDKRGWTMFASIDRVYDAGKAAQKLGFVCRTGFSGNPGQPSLRISPDRGPPGPLILFAGSAPLQWRIFVCRNTA